MTQTLSPAAATVARTQTQGENLMHLFRSFIVSCYRPPAIAVMRLSTIGGSLMLLEWLGCVGVNAFVPQYQQWVGASARQSQCIDSLLSSRPGPTLRAESDSNGGDTPPSLESIFGKGKGKHAREKRRKKENKYKQHSRVRDDMDPLDELLLKAERANNPEKFKEEEAEARRREQRIRDEYEYPGVEEIDPYDPGTFGFIEAGVVLGAHGVDGVIKVRATSEIGEEALSYPGLRHMKARNRRYPRPLNMTEGRQMLDDVYLVRLAGVESRDAAHAMRDSRLYVREEDRPQLLDDEFFVREMIGMDVVMGDGEGNEVKIGVVIDMVTSDEMSRGGLANDLLEVELLNEEGWEDAEEEGPPPVYTCLVPFVRAIVPEVDKKRRVIRIDPPPGLLELAVEKEEKVVIRGFLPSRSDFTTRRR